MAKFNVMKYLKKHQKVLMVVGLVLLALLVYKHITSCGCYNVEGFDCVKNKNQGSLYSKIAKYTGYSISELNNDDVCGSNMTEETCNNYVLQPKPGYNGAEVEGACMWRPSSTPTPESTSESAPESTSNIIRNILMMPGVDRDTCNIPSTWRECQDNPGNNFMTCLNKINSTDLKYDCGMEPRPNSSESDQ